MTARTETSSTTYRHTAKRVCPRCYGACKISESRPVRESFVVYLDDQGCPCDPCDGGKAQTKTYLTGQYKTYYEVCTVCGGTGKVAA